MDQNLTFGFDGFLNSVQLHEIRQGKILHEEVQTQLLLFRGFNHPSYDVTVYIDLLQKLEIFEKTNCILEALSFFYGPIARVALYAGQIQKAVMYAVAGIEVCEHNKDTEGVITNQSILCDIALSIGSSVHAMSLFKVAHPHIQPPFQAVESPEEDAIFARLLKSSKRPKTHAFMFDHQLIVRENAIRLIMTQMGISRQTAINYVS